MHWKSKYNILKSLLYGIMYFFSAFSAFKLSSQSATHLYIFSLHQTPDGAYHISSPKYLSGFNPGGYTNQPFFTPSGELLVSVRKTGESQNDIWSLSLSSKKCRQLTRTASNEYSPRVTPDGKNYSVLRQEEGEPINQQVWQLPLKGGYYSSLTPDIRNIGYYAWLSKEEIALYKIEGEQNRLIIYNLTERKTKPVTTSVGRTLLSDQKGSVFYVHKFTDTYWYLKKYNTGAGTIDVIAETPGKTEDFAMITDGTFFTGKDSLLFFFHPGKQTGWKQCADLSIYGIRHITRLAISPDGKQLALVVSKD